MSQLNRTVVLNTLIKHETLTIDDVALPVNIGFVPDKTHLQLLLTELTESGHLDMLNGAQPPTYTITEKGISEGNRIATEA